MNKHTPGPWTVEETRDGMTIRDNRRRLEIVHNYPNGEGQQVIVGKHTGLDCLTDANATLITAAPDMLEALKALVEKLKRKLPALQYHSCKREFEQALGAIAKAEGEA